MLHTNCSVGLNRTGSFPKFHKVYLRNKSSSTFKTTDTHTLTGYVTLSVAFVRVLVQTSSLCGCDRDLEHTAALRRAPLVTFYRKCSSHVYLSEG